LSPDAGRGGAQPACPVPNYEPFGAKNQFFGADEQAAGGGKSYITKNVRHPKGPIEQPSNVGRG